MPEPGEQTPPHFPGSQTSCRTLPNLIVTWFPALGSLGGRALPSTTLPHLPRQTCLVVEPLPTIGKGQKEQDKDGTMETGWGRTGWNPRRELPSPIHCPNPRPARRYLFHSSLPSLLIPLEWEGNSCSGGQFPALIPVTCQFQTGGRMPTHQGNLPHSSSSLPSFHYPMPTSLVGHVPRMTCGGRRRDIHITLPHTYITGQTSLTGRRTLARGPSLPMPPCHPSPRFASPSLGTDTGWKGSWGQAGRHTAVLPQTLPTSATC